MKVIREPANILHYNIFHYDPNESMGMLRSVFPDGEADEMNFCLFSTSGVHGSYSTLEEAESWIGKDGEEKVDHITFLLVHPRTVTLRYGNVIIESYEDIDFLKKLRKTSTQVVKDIGYGQD